jgi:hypothetical protein
MTENRIELTDAIVKSATCPPGKTQAYLHDAKQPGLAVRLRAGGSRSFVYFSTRPGQKGSHRISIGPFPKIRTATARSRAASLAGKRADGVDLVAARREGKQAAKAAAKVAAKAKHATLGALVEAGGLYEADLTSRGVVNAATALSALRRNLLPDHRATDVARLTRLDVTTAMDKLTHAGKRGASADLRKRCYSFLEWAVGKGFAGHNVLAGMKLPKATRAERLGRKAKGRALSDLTTGEKLIKNHRFEIIEAAS